MDQEPKLDETSAKKPVKPKRNSKWLLMLPPAVLLLVAAAAAGAYFWQQAIIDSNNKELSSLHEQVEALKTRIAKQEKQASTNETKIPTSVPNSQTRENTEAAIESGNYSALLNVFNNKVDYVIAASEAAGEHTAAQAVEDLKYLDSASAPWDFNLPTSELESYAASKYYGKYFPTTGAVVGKSADNKVVSLIFNSDGKIVTLFMSADATLLNE
ncbi:MAG TPA: hypothetical protein PK265_03385 [Candidatus Saccharibacteria bacterium]|nr:hypothetical protein [Candidatus Saccharibacteria bacterium]HRQ98338.1 hypothetical protein [Candidatus Saccharibacteria bacterium]